MRQAVQAICLAQPSSLSLVGMLFALMVANGYAPETARAGKELDAVKGASCYHYGDNETPAQARRAAIILAQEEAVRMHKVFVQSSSMLFRAR